MKNKLPPAKSADAWKPGAELFLCTLKGFNDSVSAVFIDCRLTESLFKYFNELFQGGNVLRKPGGIYPHLFRHMAVAGANGLDSQLLCVFIGFFICLIGSASV